MKRACERAFCIRYYLALIRKNVTDRIRPCPPPSYLAWWSITPLPIWKDFYKQSPSLSRGWYAIRITIIRARVNNKVWVHRHGHCLSPWSRHQGHHGPTWESKQKQRFIPQLLERTYVSTNWRKVGLTKVNRVLESVNQIPAIWKPVCVTNQNRYDRSRSLILTLRR